MTRSAAERETVRPPDAGRSDLGTGDTAGRDTGGRDTESGDAAAGAAPGPAGRGAPPAAEHSRDRRADRPGSRPAPAPGRARRDAAASREAIERAARLAFARQPYSDITLKAIAEDAGVSAPLVIKYFGSKERLFARVADFEREIGELLDAPLAELGRHMVDRMIDALERGRAPLLRIAFVLQHAEQGELLRENFRRQVVDRLRARLDGPDAGLRAELAVGQLLALGLVRNVARAEAIRQADRARIVDLYGPCVQRLLDGDRSAAGGGRPA